MKKRICYPVKEKIVDNTCKTEWELLNKFGEDATYGEIYTVCCNTKCDYVLKFLPYSDTEENIGSTKEDIINEISIHQECASLGLCPQLRDAWLCDEGGAFVIGKLDETAANLLIKYKSDIVRNQIFSHIISLVDKMHLYGIIHGDLHLNNIMVKGDDSIDEDECIREKTEEECFEMKNYTFYLIDFGKGKKVKNIMDPGIINDFSDIQGHIMDLVDEYPEDKGLKNIAKCMKIYMKKFDN